MRYRYFIAAVALVPGAAPAADTWQECQIETVTLCTPEGCKIVEPTLKLYLGDYTDDRGKPAGYYYRCRRDGACDNIDNPWIGRNDKYRAFVVPEANVISRVDQDGKVMDVSAVRDEVLISRGTCWDTESQRHVSSVEPGHR